MQIDFHHGTTYVIARYAGFSHADAGIIAHSSQYVDDATNDGVLKFKNKAMYSRVASAHKMLDYKNLDELANHMVWIPFHFLPGNDSKRAGENPDAEFTNKIVCKPNSYVAQDMLDACIQAKHLSSGLHRLGITMHVYADTWAHQGFAGIVDKINEVNDVKDENGNDDSGMMAKIFNFIDVLKADLVSDKFPLGHGAALSYPDRPFLKWNYTNGLGEKIQRDNPRDFMDASNHMCMAMQRYRQVDELGLTDEQKNKLKNMFLNTLSEDGDERHKAWVLAIKNGEFGFEKVEIEYFAKGKKSWKYHAIGDINDKQDKNEEFEFKPSFLDSDWALFHYALQEHRFEVLNRILPKYGICAA